MPGAIMSLRHINNDEKFAKRVQGKTRFFVMLSLLSLLPHLLWISGVTLCLTTFSLAQWHAGRQRRPLRQTLLSGISFRLLLTISLILFSLGLVLVVPTWWQKIAWLGLLVFSLWEGCTVWQKCSGRIKGN